MDDAGNRRPPEIIDQRSEINNLYFLKLGGSLITDKTRPHTHRPEVIERLAVEIAGAFEHTPGMKLVLGHGSGSFGHVPAQRYGTRNGVHTPEDWRGFAEVWQEAAALNHLVMDALHAAGLPALAFPPSAAVTAIDGQVLAWDLTPLRFALQNGLLPVVYGDVVFDRARGGTILSTEDLFTYLASRLKPGRVLLAGIEPGVWADFPACTQLIPEITAERFNGLSGTLAGAQATDVTGGMAGKVQQGLEIVRLAPGLEVLIFSGEVPGLVRETLLGASPGTVIRAALPPPSF
jgi:isopentenyl phosphate kinase